MDKIADNNRMYSRSVNVLAGKIRQRFNEEFGLPHDLRQPGDVFNDHLRPSNGRQCGFSLNTMLACFLDPRTKKLKGIPTGLDRNMLTDAVKIAAIRLERNERPSATIPAPVLTAAPKQPAWCQIADEDEDDEDETQVNTQVQHDLGLRTVENLVSAEIEGYKLEKSLLIYSSFDEIKNTGVYNNPLLWWKSKKFTYPILARLARRILSQPATSASSERLFSSAGLTIAKDRASMDPDNAEDVVYLKENWEEVMAWMKKHHS